MKQQIVVTSSSPKPRFCAGHSFEGAKSYPVDKFTPEELKDIIADRLLTVVVGFVLTHENIEDVANLAKLAGKPAKEADK